MSGDMGKNSALEAMTYRHPWWRHMEAWGAATRHPYHHGGLFTSIDRRVYHVLLAAFIENPDSALDLSGAAIAAKTAASEGSIYRCLYRLRDLGMLTWTDRGRRRRGYTLLPPEQWAGYDGHDKELPPVSWLDKY